MRLDHYLFENMLTHAEFAKIIGCSKNYIGMICRGIRISRKMAYLIRKATNDKVVLEAEFKPRKRKSETVDA